MSADQHTINGVPLSQCSQEALHREYLASMEFAAGFGLTPEQEAKMLQIEVLLADFPDIEGASADR